VKVRGYRIELGEIEAILASCPAVQSCVVLAREDTPGDKQLVGYLVSRGSKAPAAEELQNFLKDRLPEYMVPAKFIYLDSFPLTHNGKVDRKALPAPLHESARPDRDSARPRNATEEALAAIWMEMFKIENVGIHDDFFEIGGHSLLGIKVMSRIRDVLGIDLPVLNLFENPTIAALADSLTKAGVASAPALIDRNTQPAREPHSGRQQEGRWTITPMYFGAADAPLFGVYSPPNVAVARQAAVLLCAPIALEYMRTHYAMRLVASQLAKAGFHVLRFDYHGTGDSSGNVDAGQFDLWGDDIALAARTLLQTSGVRNLTVVGLRMGAALAVEALASRDIKARSLVLWDPVVSGGEYLSRLEQMHAEFTAERRVLRRPTNELLGAHFPQDLRTAIQALDIANSLPKLDVQRAALIVSGDQPRYSALLNSMRSRWPEAIFRPMSDPVDWDSLKAAYEGRTTGPIIRAVAEAAESLS
jgi:pimeloyl-ACP methyl ester carboxylesterase